MGAGTGGKVYQGLYKGKEVAIKVMKELQEEEQIEDFKKEFHIMWYVTFYLFPWHFWGITLAL